MRTAILYIAERCNQSCVFCLEVNGAWQPFVDPTTREVLAEIDRLRARGTNHITFMGGETFFRKDLPHIISHAKAKGITRVGVTTNGTVLSKKGFIQNLIDAGLDFIEFSVHGHTPEVANAIAQTAYSFERQSTALDEINEIGKPFVIVNVVVCRENKDHLVEIADYVCRKLPNTPKKFKLKFVSTQGLAEKLAEEQGVGLRFDEVDPIPVGDFLDAKGVPFWFWNFPLCRLGRHAWRSHDLGIMASDERYFDFDHRGGGGYYDSSYQFEGHVWPAESCEPCSLRPICAGLEETHRRHFGSGALVTQHADPLPILEASIRDRGGDPAGAPARLAVLRREARPAVAVIRRRDSGVARFDHPEEPFPIELRIENDAPDKRAFIKTGRFSLSYTPWDSDPEMMQRPRVIRQVERAGQALEAADKAGLSLEQAFASVEASAADGWVSEVREKNTPPEAPAPLVSLSRRREGGEGAARPA